MSETANALNALGDLLTLRKVELARLEKAVERKRAEVASLTQAYDSLRTLAPVVTLEELAVVVRDILGKLGPLPTARIGAVLQARGFHRPALRDDLARLVRAGHVARTGARGSYGLA